MEEFAFFRNVINFRSGELNAINSIVRFFFHSSDLPNFLPLSIKLLTVIEAVETMTYLRLHWTNTVRIMIDF